MKQRGGVEIYYCLDCQRLFEHPSVYTEHHDGIDVPGERFSVCPHCKSTNFVVTQKCDICFEYIDGDYVKTDDGKFICENCYIKRNISDGSL